KIVMFSSWVSTTFTAFAKASNRCATSARLLKSNSQSKWFGSLLGFHFSRYLPPHFASWFTQLDNTKWFHNLSDLLKAALVVVDTISIHERPVLVHCSDGWDRTPQIVALGQLMLDPYYRTIDGFKVL